MGAQAVVREARALPRSGGTGIDPNPTSDLKPKPDPKVMSKKCVQLLLECG